ncbi:MAG: YDG domain-containing protein, partial [Oscillospiraceae bacterium]
MKILNKKMAAMLLSVAMILNTTIPAFAQTTETLATESSTTAGASSAPNDESSSTEASSAPNDDSTPNEASSNPQDGNSVGAIIAVTSFVSLAPNIEQQTVVVGTLQDQLALPTELKAITVGENAQPNEITLTDIQWQLSTEYNGKIVAYNPEVEGSYIFTPIIPSGYTLAEGGALPQIAVTVGVAAPVNNLLNNNSITENGITIAATDGGTVAYTKGGFKLNTNGSYQVSGTWNGSITDDDGVRKSVIEVVENVTANITLSDTTIELNDGNVGWGTENKSSALGTTPLEVGDGAAANVTVTGTAKLRGGSGAAGINVHEAGTLNITKESTGTLNVVGGKAAAGIGGDCASNGGTINIAGGTINATGVQNGAAIGGGHANDNAITKYSYGNFQSINITGGTVTATAESDSNGKNGNAAAIGSGCWAVGNSGTITIDGATVYAETTSDFNNTANAIGRGIHVESDSNNRTVIINNSYVEAKTVRTDAACMPGATITDSLVFQNSRAVINTDCTISKSFTIPQGMSVVVEHGITLTLTGAVTNNGIINVFGTLVGNPSVVNNGSICKSLGATVTGLDHVTVISASCFDITRGSIVIGKGSATDTLKITQNGTDVVSISSSQNIMITGTTTTNKIEVADDVNANVILDNLNIIHNNGNADNLGAYGDSRDAGTTAFALVDHATLNVTLIGTNTLQSGVGRAGILVPTNTTLNITATSTGTLNAIGGHLAAGIGSDYLSNGGTINIAGGTINAKGGACGAAIGGGYANDHFNPKHSFGSFTAINITGGIITADAYSGGAAIGTGCWATTGAGTINIVNAIVYATENGGIGTIGRGRIPSGADTTQNPITIATSAVFKNRVGTIIGEAFTLKSNYTLPKDSFFYIEKGKTLTIESGKSITNNGTIMNNGNSISGTITGNEATAPKGGKIDVSAGSAEIIPLVEEGYYVHQGEKYFAYINGERIVLTSNGQTSNQVFVRNCKDVDIVLDGAQLVLSAGNTSAFIVENSNVKLNLLNSNTLQGDQHNNSGLYADQNSTVTINGSGSLDAKCEGGSSEHLGINCGKIVIESGNVTADKISGNFTTGKNGSAFIFAGAILDQSGASGWRGVIFEDHIGHICDDNFTTTSNHVIPADATLIVKENQTLIIPDDKKITNNGVIVKLGEIRGNVSGNTPKTASFIKDRPWFYISDGSIEISQEDQQVLLRQSDNFYVGTSTTPIVLTGVTSPYSKVNVLVRKGCTAKITFRDINISTADAAAFDMTGANVNLTLEGTNTLISGNKLAGLQAPEGSILIIGGTGSLASTGNGGAGIGGGTGDNNRNCGTITINDGTVTTYSSNGAGIGGGCSASDSTIGRGGTVTINGGTIISRGNPSIGGSDGGSITINGGTVTANDISRTNIIGNAGGTVTVNGGVVTTNKINGTFTTGTKDGVAIFADSITDTSKETSWKGLICNGKNGKIYGNSFVVNKNIVMPAGVKLTLSSADVLTVKKGKILTNNGIIELTGGTLNINGTLQNNGVILKSSGTINGSVSGNAFDTQGTLVGDLLVLGGTQGVDYSFDKRYENDANARLHILTSEELTIKGSTVVSAIWIGSEQNQITANLIFDGVAIENNSYYAAVDITAGSKLNLTLANGSTNTLKIGGDTPVITVPSASEFTVTDKGMGSLNASTTNYSQAVIGSTAYAANGKIVINGGNINCQAISGNAIGCGRFLWGEVSNPAIAGDITINGGTVTASGGSSGMVGIGNNNDNIRCKVTINGGTVTASGGSDNSGNNRGAGISGTFTTGTSGKAVIMTNSIKDQTNKENWSGIIFEDTSGSVYGTPIVSTDAETSSDKALTIKNGNTLNIASGTTYTNNGIITVESGGAITVQSGGKLINNGTINTSGTITGTITGKQPRENSKMEITFALKDTPDVPLKAEDMKYGQTVIITANISAATQKISGQEKEGKVTFRRTTASGENPCELGVVPVTNNTASLEVPLAEFNANPIKWASGLNYTISAELDGSDKFIKSSATANVTLGEYTALLMPPTLQFKSHSSIKLNPASVTGVIGDVQPTIEYSLGAEGTRVSTPEFTGLTPNTSYDIYTHMSGGNCVSGTVSMTVKTEALTLTANTGISAAGTYGEPLSKLAFANHAVTDDLGRTVEGSWSFEQTDAHDVYPTVGGEQSYTAQFRPTSNAEWYNNGATLTVEITPTMEYLKDAADGVVGDTTQPNENGWYNQRYGKETIALYNPSGYSINKDGAINSWYNRVYINLIDGKETKEVYYLHNIETGKIAQKTFTYNCDRALPDISLAYSEHKTFLNWILGTTSLKITATVGDKLSGIDKLEYTKTEKGTATTQEVKIDENNKGEIIVKDNFKGTIKFAVTDKAGNKKEIYADQLSNSTPADNGGIITDCTKPQITIVDANGKAFTDRWYQTAQKVYVSVNDQVGDAVSSGIESVGYTVDTSNFILYSDNKTKIVSEVSDKYFQCHAGEKEYTITATDNAGNSTSMTIPIKVDSAVPIIVHSTISTVVTDTTATTTFTAEDYGTVYYVYSTTDEGYTVDDIIKQNKTVPMTADDKNRIELAQLKCNTTYYLHIAAIDKAGNKSAYTSNTELITAKSDITGSVSINNTTPRFGDVITATAQVATANAGALTYVWGESTTAQGNTYTVTKEDIDKPISVYVGAANCNNKLQAATEIVTKAVGIAPTNGIVNDAKGINTFTFHTVSGTTYEYTTDGWITKNTLTATGDTASIQIGNRNLDANALKVCAKETATHFASAVLSNSIAFTESIEGSVTISGKAEYGEVLTAKAAVQSGATVQYQWYADKTKRGTDSSYTLAKEDIGKKITVVIKAAGYADTLSSTAADAVAKRQITATAIAKDKTYNSSTDATVSFTFANTVNNDAVTATATAAFASKEAGANKEVTVSSFALEETWQNYYTCTSLTNPTATITQKPITAKKGTLTITKIYDGTTAFTATNAVGSLALEQVHENDAVTAEITDYGNAENVNVGVKTTTLRVGLSGKDANNYKIATTLCVGDAQITQKPLTSQMVQSIPAVTYTGNEQTPPITLIDKDISAVPVSASNYTVKYTHNQNAGTATVIITAKGNYSSEITSDFTINKALPITSVTAVKAEAGKDGAGQALATHNDTLLLSANIDGVENGTKPSGSVQFFMKENDGIYRAINGAECVEVKEGIATVTLKNPPVGTLSFKAEFTASDHSNYTSSTNTSAQYNIDKGEQKGFSIIHVPDQVTYGDCFTVQTDGGSVKNGVTYEITAGNDVVSIHNTSGEVTTLKSGTATIKATKAGDNSFNSITATATITVGKAAPQIKFAENKQTVSYNGSTIAIKAPEITLVKNEIYSQSQNGSILYQYRTDQTQEWQKGLPTNVGTYTVRASLDEKGNYLGGISENITLIIQKVPAQPTAIPSDLRAVTNTQKTLAAVPLPKDEKGTWSWKNEKTPLVADNHNTEQSFKAIFTPSDKDNYVAFETELKIKVSKIVATFEKLDLVTITEENGSAEISAKITIIGATLPTEGKLELGQMLEWNNSAPNIIRVDTNNEGMSYKATVTGLTSGISMVGIRIDGKSAGRVLVKYAPNNQSISNNVARDIDHATNAVNDIVTDLENLTDTEKAVVNSLGDELLRLSPEEKEKLAVDTIESLDRLVEKAQNITTQSKATVEPSVENPIDTKKIEVKGMALASGSIADNKVEVNIKQQAPTQSQDGKQATLEFAMEMIVNGKPQQLESPLLITLQLPRGVDTKDMVIRHTKQDGTTEDITYSSTLSSGHYTTKGSSITMWVNSFSTFTFMIAKNVVPPVTPPISEEITNNENEFWIGVVAKIQSAQKGDVLKIDADACIKMPAYVMEELRIKGVGMIMKWNGGKEIVIPAGKACNAEKNRDFWTLAELAELYKKYSFVTDQNKTSPNTGAETYGYVDNQTGETTPVTGSILEVTPIPRNQSVRFIWMIIAGMLVVTAVTQGMNIWKK